ncbi:hypothetical protein C2G38_1055116 [Gigaspora rosea]|uniref:Ion transport domain-containing protein n=1 Tax=Gigaspora rosea TaxID=44941 RepID=A0A397VJ43_9GLOM|nr:hypothetical protein C2G38_1055116 [Gigaspora rosea]
MQCKFIVIIKKQLLQISLLTSIILVYRYLLLRNPPQINLNPSGSSFIIQNASDPNSNNAFSDLIITQSYDTFDINDNYFSNFWKSLESVFFWINGRWDQLDQWNFVPIDILTLLASILLVTIMQNMLIAFMT